MSKPMFIAAAAATFVLAFLSTAEAGLPRLFSIDWNSDVLYTINVNTGIPTPVGPLNYDVNGGGDMTFFNGKLYHITPDSTDPFGPQSLLEIDPATATVLSSHQLTMDGNLKQGVAEGLTVQDGNLIIAFDGILNNGRSNSIGMLSLSGEITNPIDFGTPYSADMDGLTTTPGGEIFATDTTTDSDSVNFYEVGLSPQSYQLVGTYTDSSTVPAPRANDIAFLGSRFFGIDHHRDRFQEFDPNTGDLVAEFFLSTATDFTGLATPEPSSFAMLLTAGVLAIRRKRIG